MKSLAMRSLQMMVMLRVTLQVKLELLQPPIQTLKLIMGSFLPAMVTLQVVNLDLLQTQPLQVIMTGPCTMMTL